MQKSIAFVYPYENNQPGDKASSIRPFQMEQAFRRVLADGLIVTNGKNRFSRLAEKNLQGVYIESINRPFFIQRLLEKKVNIFKDYISIRQLKKRGVKLSIFYRDGFWAGSVLFDLYSYPVALFLRLFYRLEWQFIKNNFDNIYLPSLELAEYMGETDKFVFKALLPGCTSKILKKNRLNPDKKLKNDYTFLYAGGIIPPLNDISLMLELLGNRPVYKLILILRKEELELYTDYYQFEKYSNIEFIVSKKDEQLIKWYSQADATLLLYPFHLYRYLAMPYKAFESISYGLPIISFSDNVMGKFIERHRLGISMTIADLDNLFSNYELLDKKLKDSQLFVTQYAIKHTWESRVETIISDMSKT